MSRRSFANHPSERWCPAQLEAARAIAGRVEDLAFPEVDPKAGETEVESMADELVRRILERNPAAVALQGEFTLTTAVLRRLRDEGIPCYAACSARTTEETSLPGGTQKTSTFEFKRWRRYADGSKPARGD